MKTKIRSLLRVAKGESPIDLMPLLEPASGLADSGLLPLEGGEEDEDLVQEAELEVDEALREDGGEDAATATRLLTTVQTVQTGGIGTAEGAGDDDDGLFGILEEDSDD